jgi:peptidoglycan hydrolase-like protein with peptidoglycan-binding domain
MSDDPLIPLPRIVGVGDSGLDVFAYRRALKSLGLVPHAKRGRFEENMVEGVTAFQKQANITQTGTIGKRTYALLFRHIDAFGRSQLASFARRQKVRDRMVAEQRWAIANCDQIHYPLHDVRKPGETADAVERWQNHELPITLDCSEFAACIAAAADAPDPTGTSFGVRGPVFTGTMLSHCREIQQRDLKPGDYVVLGPDTGKHACVVLSVDDPANPILTSHGQEKGPLSIALNDESGAHPPPVRFLSAGIK